MMNGKITKINLIKDKNKLKKRETITQNQSPDKQVQNWQLQK